jgi:hypothetical protein
MCHTKATNTHFTFFRIEFTLETAFVGVAEIWYQNFLVTECTRKSRLRCKKNVSINPLSEALSQKFEDFETHFRIIC